MQAEKTAEVGILSAFWLWDGKAATPAVSFTVQQAVNGDMTVSDLKVRNEIEDLSLGDL